MTISVGVHASQQAAGSGGVTSAAIDTSGANLLVAVACYNHGATITFSDSKSNTWNKLTNQDTSGASAVIYWSTPTSVGSGHTFTVAGTSSFSTFAVGAFSSALASSPFDVQTGGFTSSTVTQATGNVTPTVTNEILIAGLGWNGASSPLPTVSNGFTVLDNADFLTSKNFGVSLAYKIQTSIVTEGTTFTKQAPANNMAAVIASFKAAVGGGSPLMRATDLSGLGASGGFFHDPTGGP